MQSTLSPVARFNNILLASDGSPHGAGALMLAEVLAQHCKAELYILRIVQTNPEYEFMAASHLEEQMRAAEQALEDMAQKARERGISCQCIVRTGMDPCNEVVQMAEELRADCVMIGRRPHGRLARLLLGDSSTRILRHAPCSVLIAGADAEQPKRGIMVATDGSRQADAACLAAARLAGMFQLPLKIVSVATLAGEGHARGDAEGIVQRVVEALREELGDGCPSIDGLIEQGRPEEAIVACAHRHNVDLLVLGSHGRKGLDRILLGSVSERVLGQAPCPVLIVR